MAKAKITVNGQPYDSPEAMPPDVRRTYEEAMRLVGPSLAGGQGGGKTQVFTSRLGSLGANVIVNKIVTVNDRTYGSTDELPPEVRKQYEDALEAAVPQAHPKTSLHLALSVEGPQVRTRDTSRPAPPLPIEASTLESRIRDIPVTLAIWIGIGLVLWFLLGR